MTDKAYTFRAPEEFFDTLERVARAEGITKKDVMMRAVSEYVTSRSPQITSSLTAYAKTTPKSLRSVEQYAPRPIEDL